MGDDEVCDVIRARGRSSLSKHRPLVRATCASCGTSSTTHARHSSHTRSRSLILSHAHIYTRTHTPHATTPGLDQAKNTERRSFSTAVAHVIEQGDDGGGCFQKGRVCCDPGWC